MTLPAKLQSYMACGTPIIAAAGGDRARVIREAECGFVCEQDADKLSDMVKNLVIQANKLDEMRINAEKYFNEHFSVDLVVNALENAMCGE